MVSLPPLECFGDLLARSDSLTTFGDSSGNEGNVLTSPLSLAQTAFVHETLLDSHSSPHEYSPASTTNGIDLHGSFDDGDDHGANQFLCKILKVGSFDTTVDPNLELIVSTFLTSNSTNRILMTYQFLLRYSHAYCPYANVCEEATVLYNLMNLGLPLLFSKTGGDTNAATNMSSSSSLSSSSNSNIKTRLLVRDAFMAVLMPPHPFPDNAIANDAMAATVTDLVSTCASYCSNTTRDFLMTPSSTSAHIPVETACRILIRLLDIATIPECQDTILDEMQAIVLSVIRAVAYQPKPTATSNGDITDGNKIISSAPYSSILMRPVTALLLPRLYKESSGKKEELQAKRAQQLWSCLIELMSSDKNSNNERQRCRQWDNVAPTIAMGIMCTNNTLASILSTAVVTTHDYQILFKSIISSLCRFGEGTMGGRMQTNKNKSKNSNSDDQQQQQSDEEEEVNQSRSAIDQLLRRRAIHVFRLLVEIRASSGSNNNSIVHTTLSPEDELTSMLKDVSTSEKRQTKKNRNKNVDALEISRLDAIATWKKYIICYETLEMEGEQHLIDPIFPVLTQLCAAISKEEGNLLLSGSPTSKADLPTMTWEWVGALLTRVFLSENPTIRKLALYRFFNGDAGIYMPGYSTGNTNRSSSSKPSTNGTSIDVIEESYIPILLQSYDSLSGGGGVGTVIQFTNPTTGKTQSENITPRMLSFLTHYISSLDASERQETYLNYALGDDACIGKFRTKTICLVFQSVQRACQEKKVCMLQITNKALNGTVDGLKKMMSTGGMIPAVKKTLLQAFAIILQNSTYGRKTTPNSLTTSSNSSSTITVADPIQVLKILTLFLDSVADKNVVVARGAVQDNNTNYGDIEQEGNFESNEKDMMKNALRSWLCNIGTPFIDAAPSNNDSGSSWAKIAGASCASSYVLGQLLPSDKVDASSDSSLLVAASTKVEKEIGAAVAKLCALGSGKDGGASSLLWPAIHRGLNGAGKSVMSPEMSKRAMRAMILLECSCVERVIGGMGNGEMLLLSSAPSHNGEKRDVISPPPPSIEALLHDACMFSKKQIQNITLLKNKESHNDEVISIMGSTSSRCSTTNILSSHFSTILSQLMSVRFAFPSSIVISNMMNETLGSSLDCLLTRKKSSSRELVKNSALTYAALLCWAEVDEGHQKITDACNLLLTVQFSDDNNEGTDEVTSKNIQQASRSIFQYAKWGALSLLVPKIADHCDSIAHKQILEKVCYVALDSVNATPTDALLPLFDCCLSALKIYTQSNLNETVNNFSSVTIETMIQTIFAVMNDMPNSRTRMIMIHQICTLLFRPSVLTWEYQDTDEGSHGSIHNAFRELMITAGTSRPHIAKTVISRLAVGWLGSDGTGKPAIPYRKDIADLLVYKECRNHGGLASAYQEEQDAIKNITPSQDGADMIFLLPGDTHELSVVRGFVLLFLSKLPDQPPQEVMTKLIHWIIIYLLETVCNTTASSSVSLMTGSQEYCQKIRAWQALCLLSRFVTADIATDVSKHVFGCLSINMHGQIRYFCEVFTIRCTKLHPDCFGTKFVEEINRVDLSLQQVASLMIIGGNLIVGDPQYTIPFLRSGVSLHKILAGIIPWLSSTQGFSRAIAQLLVHTLIPLTIDVSNNEKSDTNHWFLLSIYKFLDQNSEMKRLRRKQVKFFGRYAIDSVCTPEGLLSIPVDSGDEANPPHMVDIIKRCLEEVYEEAHEADAPMWKQVEELIVSPSARDDQDEVDELSVTFQRKILPLDTLNLAMDQAREIATRNAAGQKKRPLIVCATFVDKVPNLAGLARTAEIFAADRLVIPDLHIRKMDNFKSISVGAGDWIELEECKEKDLLVWLNKRREEGYSIVGLEQTSSSSCISDFKFPERTVILLGREKEGIPVEFLHVVDTCVEIPQLGIIRSLNVHVTGALAIWEYSKQMMMR